MPAVVGDSVSARRGYGVASTALTRVLARAVHRHDLRRHRQPAGPYPVDGRLEHRMQRWRRPRPHFAVCLPRSVRCRQPRLAPSGRYVTSLRSPTHSPTFLYTRRRERESSSAVQAVSDRTNLLLSCCTSSLANRTPALPDRSEDSVPKSAGTRRPHDDGQPPDRQRLPDRTVTRS